MQIHPASLVGMEVTPRPDRKDVLPYHSQRGADPSGCLERWWRVVVHQEDSEHRDAAAVVVDTFQAH